MCLIPDEPLSKGSTTYGDPGEKAGIMFGCRTNDVAPTAKKVVFFALHRFSTRAVFGKNSPMVT